jgi:hypothetical protein
MNQTSNDHVGSAPPAAFPSPLFPLGNLHATPGALAAIEAAGLNPLALISRHVRGDYGDLCASDKKANLQAIKDGSRILSAYVIAEGVKVYVITEASRELTTVLLSDEY